MGKCSIPRSNPGGGVERVGDIKVTTRTSLGDKWVLCNGDPKDGGEVVIPDIADEQCWTNVNGINTNEFEDINRMQYAVYTDNGIWIYAYGVLNYIYIKSYNQNTGVITEINTFVNSEYDTFGNEPLKMFIDPVSSKIAITSSIDETEDSTTYYRLVYFILSTDFAVLEQKTILLYEVEQRYIGFDGYYTESGYIKPVGFYNSNFYWFANINYNENNYQLNKIFCNDNVDDEIFDYPSNSADAMYNFDIYSAIGIDGLLCILIDSNFERGIILPVETPVSYTNIINMRSSNYNGYHIIENSDSLLIFGYDAASSRIPIYKYCYSDPSKSSFIYIQNIENEFTDIFKLNNNIYAFSSLSKALIKLDINNNSFLNIKITDVIKNYLSCIAISSDQISKSSSIHTSYTNNTGNSYWFNGNDTIERWPIITVDEEAYCFIKIKE